MGTEEEIKATVKKEMEIIKRGEKKKCPRCGRTYQRLCSTDEEEEE